MLRTSLLDDPLADWPNDDMLVRQDSRERLANTRPALLRVLEWPELSAAFQQHDRLAIANKRWSHRQGIAAVLLSGAGVILLGAAALLPANSQVLGNALALAFMLFGALMGIAHFTLLRSKHHWLGHRFWAERLRQLLYQSVVGAFDLTSRAMTDDVALTELRQARRCWLEDTYAAATDPREHIRRIETDATEKRTWLRVEWGVLPTAVAPHVGTDELFDGLRHLRLGIQCSFAARNLGNDVYSAPLRDRLLSTTVQLASVLAAVLAGLGLTAALLGWPPLGVGVAGWTVAAGTLSAIGLMAQSVSAGLQARADVERYRWYADEVDACAEQFDSGTARQKLAAAHRLENAAYRELRAFLRAHGSARFTS